MEDHLRKIQKKNQGDSYYVTDLGVSTEELRNWCSQIQTAVCACIKITNREILHSLTDRMDSTASDSLCNTIRQKPPFSCLSIYNIRIGNLHRSIHKPVLGIVWYHREFEQKR